MTKEVILNSIYWVIVVAIVAASIWVAVYPADWFTTTLELEQIKRFHRSEPAGDFGFVFLFFWIGITFLISYFGISLINWVKSKI